jgi:hypothetical protein
MNKGQPQERGAGPTTPRRPVERDYLAALADLVSLETWREICQRTVEAAKAGNPKARDWLARYLIGPDPMGLVDMAADERAGFSTDELVERVRQSRQRMRALSNALS